ncbi:MAG: repeat protein [Verrucomicrobiales bacterium]|nr:repeat protein [Verrucomicrobiales bacterium]
MSWGVLQFAIGLLKEWELSSEISKPQHISSMRMANSKAHEKLIQQKLKEGQKFLFAEPPDPARAATILAELTHVAPNSAEGFFWLASALLSQPDFSKAEAAFRKAIALDPTDSRAHLSLGSGLEQAGRLKEAVQCYRDGLALKPHYGEADSRLMLASVLKKLGRMDEAVVEWQTVASMEPMYPSYEEPMNEAKRELKNHGW